MGKSRAEIAELMNRIFTDLQATREAGQKEYAHDEDNAFANFERTATEIGITREKVLWTFFNKHKDGIAAYLNGHTSQREDVRGRIKDMMVYLVLLWGMIEDKSAIPSYDLLGNAIKTDNRLVDKDM